MNYPDLAHHKPVFNAINGTQPSLTLMMASEQAVKMSVNDSPIHVRTALTRTIKHLAHL